MRIHSLLEKDFQMIIDEAGLAFAGAQRVARHLVLGVTGEAFFEPAATPHIVLEMLFPVGTLQVTWSDSKLIPSDLDDGD
jgi:hypothetical protein